MGLWGATRTIPPTSSSAITRRLHETVVSSSVLRSPLPLMHYGHWSGLDANWPVRATRRTMSNWRTFRLAHTTKRVYYRPAARRQLPPASNPNQYGVLWPETAATSVFDGSDRHCNRSHTSFSGVLSPKRLPRVHVHRRKHLFCRLRKACLTRWMKSHSMQ